MVIIREYRESDAPGVGRLIADTFEQFNLGFASPEQKRLFLGPLRHAHSPEPAHQEAIANVLRTEIAFVAEDEGEIVGVVRGRHEWLQSLFVRGDHHRQGIGRQLVARFEEECRRRGMRVIRLQATLLGVPFYLKMGYKRSTGVRLGRVFDGRGFPYQPMKKVLL